MQQYQYYGYIGCCTSLAGIFVAAMKYTATQISRRTFLKYVDPSVIHEIEQALGYERTKRKGLTMKDDFHVSYWRSMYRGQPCVFFQWSAIEYVFTKGIPPA